MKVAYFDCISGASGDMLLGALLDAGVPEIVISDALSAIELEDWDVGVEQVVKGGVRAAKLWISGNDEVSERRYPDIVAMLENSGLEASVRARALDTFRRLGEAEARIHDVALEDLHLHEVGATDAIIDVVGTCAALAHLGSERVICSPVPTGRGFTESAHGTIPIPAPAVTEILTDIPLIERGDRELITPTGAALLAACCDLFGPMPALLIDRVGYGAGAADLEIPNIMRVILGEKIEVDADEAGTELLQTNIDDMSPELLPYVIERLIAAGASDAWAEPLEMKKSRTGVRLSVIAEPTATKDLIEVLFHETTTFGIRIAPLRRATLDRRMESVQIEGHGVRIKIGTHNGEVVTVAPEYEDAAAVARSTGKPLREIFEAARRAADQLL
ncbi:MAG: nickel pincer cofactor biosynthesis protein LarC [Actinomycetota bacterium]|nr:nickel pincer cofactor biosynthesis protein LarC [Actinomycetota bacterium]